MRSPSAAAAGVRPMNHAQRSNGRLARIALASNPLACKPHRLSLPVNIV
jgi:hypothetical protein